MRKALFLVLALIVAVGCGSGANMPEQQDDQAAPPKLDLPPEAPR